MNEDNYYSLTLLVKTTISHTSNRQKNVTAKQQLGQKPFDKIRLFNINSVLIRSPVYIYLVKNVFADEYIKKYSIMFSRHMKSCNYASIVF